MPNWKKVIVSGSDASLNSLNVTTSLTASGLIYPTTDGTVNQVIQTDGLGNLSFGSVDTTYETVKNVSGTTLYKGTPVHATASNASGNVVGIIAASASNPATMPATFILNEDLADEAEGEAIISGLIQGVNTSLFEEGDIVYVGENSGYTNVQPTGSNLIQNLGIVTKIHPTAGAGIVLGAGRSNATPNLLNGEIFWGENNKSIQKPLAHILSGSSFTYSGSFSGSFEGDGSNLTGIQVASLQSNFNVTPFTSTGSITINHNLNATYPLVQVYDSSDNQIIPDTIEIIDTDNVKITFATPRTGNVVIGKGGDIIDLTQVIPPTTRAITGSFTAVTSSIITHAFQTENVLVSVYDSTKNYIIPDSIQILDGDNVQVGFSTPTTGYAVITNGGHIVSGSIEWDNVLNKPSGIVSSSAQLSDSTIPGNLTIQGTLTAQQFNTEFVSASIIYRSGSTKFGDTLDDIHSFTGSLEISGSLISDGDVLPHTTDIYNLGSPTKRWGDVYLTSASIYLNNTKLSATSDGKVSGSFTGSFVGDGSQLSGVTSYTNDDTLSYINTLGVVSSSAQLSEFTGSFSGSFYGDGSNLSGVTSYTDADTLTYINSIGVVSGSVNWDTLIGKPSGIVSSSNQLSDSTIPGNLTVGGILTAQEFHTEFVSASIIYDSGSTQFGNSLDDIHNFSGSLAVNTDNLFVSGGNVGIGTSSPGARLQIISTNSNDGHIRIGGGAGLDITHNNSSYTTAEIKQLYASTSPLAQLKITSGFTTFQVGTGASEAMRITSTGNVGIGTTNPTTKLYVLGGETQEATSGEATFKIYKSGRDRNANNNHFTSVFRDRLNNDLAGISVTTSTGTNQGSIRFFTSNTTDVGNWNLASVIFKDNGNVGIGTTSPAYTLHVNGSVAGVGAYVNLSDIDYKKNIYDLTYGLDKILQLRPVTFNWKNEEYGDRINTGFIAQEVEDVLPNSVITAEDSVKSIATSELIAVLTKAVQEQQAIIETQNTKITELETALQALITRVEQLENQ